MPAEPHRFMAASMSVTPICQVKTLAMMARQARDTSMIMDCGKPMITRVPSRHAPEHPYCRAL